MGRVQHPVLLFFFNVSIDFGNDMLALLSSTRTRQLICDSIRLNSDIETRHNTDGMRGVLITLNTYNGSVV